MEEEQLILAAKHNQFGAFCLKAGMSEKAIVHFRKALDLVPSSVPFTNINSNLGNAYADLRQHQNAIEQYLIVINNSPHNQPNPEEQWLHPKLNSPEALAQTYSNLAVMYMSTNQIQEAEELLRRAISMNLGTEAHVNLGNLLRQLRQRDEAIEHVWQQIEQRARDENFEFERPRRLRLREHVLPEGHMEGILHVVCVKWGTKYGPDYVNKLYNGVERHLSAEHDFICFTENGEGLDSGIRVIELPENWYNWWGKATLFSDHGLEGRMMYIDLDSIITGSLDDLASYTGTFALLSTEDIFCETAKDGYNSSIILWHTSFGREIYSVLKAYYDHVLKFIARFDHWLEMMVEDSDFVQTLFPGQFLDYSTYCKEAVPEGCRMVCFPREPKPHSCEAPWVSEYWV